MKVNEKLSMQLMLEKSKTSKDCKAPITIHTVLIQAENGQDLLVTYKKTHQVPEVHIMDHMPVMDGFELAKEIKGQFCEMKVIAFSMSSSQPDIKRVLLCGADRFIYKDDFEQLQEVLSSLGNNTFHI